MTNRSSLSGLLTSICHCSFVICHWSFARPSRESKSAGSLKAELHTIRSSQVTFALLGSLKRHERPSVRSALRCPHARQVSGFRLRGGDFAGAGHWRQHGHLQSAGPGLVTAAAGEKSGTARATPMARLALRQQHRIQRPVVSAVQGHPRQKPGIQRRVVPLLVAIEFGYKGQTEGVGGGVVFGHYFGGLGGRAGGGRTITPDDDRIPGGPPGAGSDYGFWRDR